MKSVDELHAALVRAVRNYEDANDAHNAAMSAFYKAAGSADAAAQLEDEHARVRATQHARFVALEARRKATKALARMLGDDGAVEALEMAIRSA